jgi:hypothetical protein
LTVPNIEAARLLHLAITRSGLASRTPQALLSRRASISRAPILRSVTSSKVQITPSSGLSGFMRFAETEHQIELPSLFTNCVSALESGLLLVGANWARNAAKAFPSGRSLSSGPPSKEEVG